MTIDLNEGNPDYAELSEAAQKRVASQVKRASTTKPASKSSSRSTAGRPTAAQKAENEIASRIDDVFEQIASALEDREDEELATVIRQDSQKMANGLVSLTRNIKPLRPPLLFALNLIQPILAFGRIIRILYFRIAERQARRRAEAEQQGPQYQDTPTQQYTPSETAIYPPSDYSTAEWDSQ